MRVAIITDTFYPQINGVSNTLAYLSRYLSKNRIEHLIVAPDYGNEPCGKDFPLVRFRGYQPLIYPECRLSFPPPGAMQKTLEDFSPDVVHIVTEFSLGFCALKAAQALDVPIVMSYHTDFDKYLRFYHLECLGKALWGYLKWFHGFARGNLCPSGETLARLRKKGLPRLGVWSRGVDLSRFSPGFYCEKLREDLGAKDRLIFLYVGRIAREKGLDTLLSSISSFNGKHPGKVLFVMTGDGPYREELEGAQVPNLLFTGALQGKELSRIYASADVFLFPSGTETFGNVLLEAMASGLPCVSANAGGVLEFAVHNKNALLFEYENASSLSGAMEKMLSPALRARLRKGARETAGKRSWDGVFDGLLQKYRVASADKAEKALRAG